VRDDRPTAPPAAVDRFFARMRAERFDLAVQLHGGGRHSNPFLRRLGAGVTAGSRTPNAQPLDRTVPYTGHQHEIHRFLEVAGLVGAAPVTLEPRLQVTDADRAEAAAALAGDDRPLVVLHPGAKDPRRRWPVERLAVVGSELARKGARLAVVGTASERGLVDRLVDGLDGHAADLAGSALEVWPGCSSRPPSWSATIQDPGIWPPPSAQPPSPSTGMSASPPTGRCTEPGTGPRPPGACTARPAAPTAWKRTAGPTTRPRSSPT
jgi:hypothetical protein